MGNKQKNSKLLKKYRYEIRDITRSILDLVSARQILSQKIAEAKESSAVDIENHAVEKTLSKEMLEYSKGIRLDRDLANKIVQELIEFSKIAQRKEIYFKSIKAHLRSSGIRTVSIIGAGRMGGWLASYFKEVGARVSLFDENKLVAKSKARELGCGYSKTFEEAAKADLVMVAVPIRTTPREVLRLVRYSKENPGHLMRIMEVSSVKSGLDKAGLFRKRGLTNKSKFYSVHPLFGSNANPFSVNSLVQIGEASDLPFVSGIFPHYKIFQMNAENHDRLMSTILTIPHVHALSFADSISKLRKTIPENINSTSFDHMLDLSRRLLKDSGDLYYDIQAINPYAGRAISETMNSVARLERLFRDRSAFKKFFRYAAHELN